MKKWPSFSDAEINAVKSVLISGKVNYWTGTECREFESEFAKYCGTRFAVALMNGTIAIDTALNALNISRGDEVIVTSRTYIATISAIINSGATPVFADVDLNSQNIYHDSIKTAISKRTKAIICVHLAGWPCDMDPIMDLAKKNELFVIEDCAQAHGAKYKGQSVGSIGDIGCWSFCQDKIMTTGGEGGMVTTNNEHYWRIMWAYKDHGKSYKAVYDRHHPPGFKWLNESIGTNYRMTEMQATIGRIQIHKMREWQYSRINNARIIWSLAKKIKALRAPKLPMNIEHAAYKCYLFLDLNEMKVGWDRERVIQKINSLGVPCSTGSCSEVYLEKAFENVKYRPVKRLKNAKKLGETSLMFMVHPTLTSSDIEKTYDVISKVMNIASK
jgi:dTDP-4-amino-4,6-dideoxygalactose transaminase